MVVKEWWSTQAKQIKNSWKEKQGYVWKSALIKILNYERFNIKDRTIWKHQVLNAAELFSLFETAMKIL